jgi:hypothetical protein
MKINNEAYNQWIEQFISDVLTSAHINCNEVVIADIEPSTRIYITVDNEDYTIRTWNYTPIDKDKYNQPYSEAVDYTLCAPSGARF